MTALSFNASHCAAINLDGAHSSAEINGQKFNFGEDFLPNAVGATLTGPLVYVGHGWVVKSKNIDAYQGIDVKDKIVVVFGEGLPQGVTRADLTGKMGEDWISPALYAQQHGAKGVLAVADYGMLLRWEQTRQRLGGPAPRAAGRKVHDPDRPGGARSSGCLRKWRPLCYREKNTPRRR